MDKLTKAERLFLNHIHNTPPELLLKEMEALGLRESFLAALDSVLEQEVETGE